MILKLSRDASWPDLEFCPQWQKDCFLCFDLLYQFPNDLWCEQQDYGNVIH